MFDVTILMQWVRYFGQEPIEIDRKAIKRYLTTDESWLSKKWNEIRSRLHFPWSISIYSGSHRHAGVLEGLEPSSTYSTQEGETDELRKLEEERRPLLNSASSRSYGGH